MGHPLAFAAYLRHNGTSVDQHFRRQGLPALCEDPDAFVPLRQAWAFFDATAHDVDPMLGWHVGGFVGDHNLNRAFLGKLEHAPTLYRALQQFVQLSSSEASHLHLGIREHRDHIEIFTHYPDMKGVPGYTASQSYQIGVILGVIRHYLGKDWEPEEIGIEYPVVPTVAETLFPSSRILAAQPFGYIVIPRSCLSVSPPRGASEEGQDGSLVLTRELDYLETLRTLLRPHLSGGRPDGALAASLMDTSVRTLARRLLESGVTYRTVIDGLRFEEARKLLENTSAPIIDVAAAVGCDDASNFARMFRRLAGVSPRAYRKLRA